MAKDRHKNRGGLNKIDLTGKQFGKLKVICDTGLRKSRRPIWKCLCECGKEVNILSKYLLCGDTQSCGCITKGNAHNRSGYKYINQSFFNHIKRAAIKRGIPFSLEYKDLFDLFEKQNGICALTGLKLTIVNNYHDERLNQTASLDRIDNEKGYTVDNIQWVHKKINIMRNKLSIEEFIYFCKMITDYNLEKVHTPK